LSSCGIKDALKDIVYKDELQGGRQFQSTDPTFSNYVTGFEAAASSELGDPNFAVGDIPINFGDTENPEFQGVCFVYSDGSKEIIIKKEWWDGAHEFYRRSLIHHELGHCRLNREHDDELLAHGGANYKASIMNSEIVGPTHFRQFQDEYETELFKSDKNPLIEAIQN